MARHQVVIELILFAKHGGGTILRKLKRKALIRNLYNPVSYQVLKTKEKETHKAAWPRDYKTFFMLNSVEHEILNAHKYKNIKESNIF